LDLIIIGAVLAALAVIGIFAVSVTTGRRQRQREKQLREWRAGGRTWGISLAPPSKGRGCSAVRRLEKHVYPISSAPQLPLSNCNQSSCRCIYVAYPERRRGERRAREDRRDSLRFEGKVDRRAQGGDRRRKSDVWKDHDPFL
jgi:hypothetical protein